MVGGCLGIELRSYNGEGLRRRGDGAIEHFLPGFFHLSKTEGKKKQKKLLHQTRRIKD